MTITKTCSVSGKEFIVTDEDLAFYEKLGVPAPTLCPDERSCRRLSFRNDRSLYKRTCSKTNEDIISLYPKELPFPVYCPDEWWSEDWSAATYGKDFDFSRPFFEQFQELFNSVPQISAVITKSENCDYNSACMNCKNCYMCQRVAQTEDGLYSYLLINSRDCCDCYNVNDSELCYELVDGNNCYNVRFSQNSTNCRDSDFLFNCRNCSSCFGCTNLRNAKYYFLNQKLTKEEYEKKVNSYKTLTFEQLEDMLLSFQKLKEQSIVPSIWGLNYENASGNYIFNCKNTLDTYDATEVEEARYCWGPHHGDNQMDTSFLYHCHWAYESCGGFNNHQIRFCFNCYDGHSLDYCMHCMNSCRDCFGCVGLKKAEYHILNKAYSKHEYEILKEKIISHMKETGEWGEFFPSSISPFPYGDTVANEYFPRNIKDFSSKKFEIQTSEKAFYKKMGIPTPKLHPDIRHLKRVASRNPRKLYNRTCGDCGTDIQTTYAPERPEKILCEDCYLKVVE